MPGINLVFVVVLCFFGGRGTFLFVSFEARS